MQVIMMHRGRLEALPRVRNVAIALARAGADVDLVVSSVMPGTVSDLLEHGVRVIAVEPEYDAAEFGLISWVKFRWRTREILSRADANTRLWIGSGDTALALGRSLFRCAYILQLNELYDTVWHYRFALRGFVRGARRVVVPSPARAAIVRYWYNLTRTPDVLPNCPSGVACRPKRPISNDYARSVIESLGDSAKLVLYQGWLSEKDRNVTSVARAIAHLPDTWHLVTMGPADPQHRQLRQLCPRFHHIPSIASPYHLEVTSHAYIGVVLYSFTSLNNIFCAPNKVWEYGAYAVPMLCNDVFGLRHLVEDAHAGLCVNVEEDGTTTDALLSLDERRAEYSKAARRLYESVNIDRIVEQILTSFNS